MTILRILYLVLLVGAGMFMVLYVDSLSLLFFMVVLLLPLLLFLLLALARLLTGVRAELDKTICTKGQSARLILHFHNKSFVALSCVRVKVCYRNSLSENDLFFDELSFPLHALSRQDAVCDIKSDHVGNVELQIQGIIMHDYLRLFSLPLRLKETYTVSFIPEMPPIEMRLRPNSFLNTDSDVFSKTKKGDDPSEVFAIRDYVDGDKLNRIHWKLSSKQDTLMVKDYSLPINTNVLLLVELACGDFENPLDALDGAMQTTFTMSQFLCDAQITHYISWYDAKGAQYFTEEIRDAEDLYAAIGFMLNSGRSDGERSLACFRQGHSNYSHVAYITPAWKDATAQIISDLPYSTFYTVFRVVPETGDESTASHAGTTDTGLSMYTVSPCNTADALSTVVL